MTKWSFENLGTGSRSENFLKRCDCRLFVMTLDLSHFFFCSLFSPRNVKFCCHYSRFWFFPLNRKLASFDSFGSEQYLAWMNMCFFSTVCFCGMLVSFCRLCLCDQWWVYSRDGRWTQCCALKGLLSVGCLISYLSGSQGVSGLSEKELTLEIK